VTYTDYYLRAADEPTLVAALPMFRANGEWKTVVNAGHYEFIPIHRPIVIVPGTDHPETGEPLTAPVFASGFHVNLRLFHSHPEREAIEAAIGPFLVNPENPSLRFA
jgi:hypothetical protein